MLSLPSAPLDLALFDVLDWLFVDKANTIFAFLFGLGFYLQMQRLEARGADFERIYRRRLWVLLVIGVIHIVLHLELGHPASVRARGIRVAGVAQAQQSRPARRSG